MHMQATYAVPPPGTSRCLKVHLVLAHVQLLSTAEQRTASCMCAGTSKPAMPAQSIKGCSSKS